MLKIENTRVFNFEGALRGLRNPKNSWNKTDSQYGIVNLAWGSDELSDVAYKYLEELNLPEETDKQIELRDNEENKIIQWLDMNGLNPCYGFEGDFYEYNFIGPADLKLAQRMIGAGTDESKFMRQIFISMDITAPLYWWKEFDTYKVGTVSDSCSTMHKLVSEPITKDNFSFDIDLEDKADYNHLAIVDKIIAECELLRQKFIETKDHFYWRLLIQLLPSGWMQKRTVTLNYQVARAMYFARRFHKLSEWRTLCEFFERLPYGKALICYEKPKRLSGLMTKILTLLGIKFTDENHKERKEEDILKNVEQLAKALDIIKTLNENVQEKKEKKR